jgi:hypothetical protein
VLRQRRRISFGWWVLTVLTSLVLLGMAAEFVYAQTVTHGFNCITPGASEMDKTTGQEQLLVDITHHAGELTATFRFYNVGPQPCSITDIYIQDGHLTSFLYLINGEGVVFSIGATPGNLPDGQYAEPPFVATKRFSSDSDPPIMPNGINQGEELTAFYSVEGGTTVYDIEAEVGQGILRIGFHVQAFGDGKSAAFVNSLEQVPEPATVLLLGLGCLFFLKKRKKNY